MERAERQNTSEMTDSPALKELRGFCFRLLASGFFISYIPAKIMKNTKNSGAGLLGTALAFCLVPVLPATGPAYIIFLAAFCVFAAWVSQHAFSEDNKHDNPKIVIDEIAGYWLAIAFLPRTLWVLLACFALFRFLDTVKPFYIRKIDSLQGGIAIVLDDLAAGLLANVAVRTGLMILSK